MPIMNQKNCLSGFGVKMLGVVLMVFDHIHQMFYMAGAPVWFTWLGRPVAPLFLFMSAEGFHYTRSKRRYVLGLLIAFEVMNALSQLLQTVLPNEQVVLINSIFGTLFFATLYMAFIDLIRSGARKGSPGRVLAGIALLTLPVLWSFLALSLMSLTVMTPTLARVLIYLPNMATVEGNFTWVALGALFYLFREKRPLQFIALAAIAVFAYATGDHVQAFMLFAAVPMALYDGRRGGEGSPLASKNFFYIFYPAHIYALYILSTLLVK
ncbi:MAG: conjugal transfer protein TraX [Clostridiales Family XIII bacterium]|jgi:hypothetical protein|nr:conjugal transfer protein TraX [Clostridiales Family XIII bacterium]